MNKNQNKTSLAFPLTIFGVAVALVVLSLLTNLTSRTSLNSKGAGVQPPVNQEKLPAIQNTNDLNSVGAELDSADLGELDRELNLLDIDASAL